jgi:CheY-like chemotaxis protein
MKIFILDDEIYKAPRNQIIKALHAHNLDIAVSYYDAKDRYKGEYDILLLDHDMRGYYDVSTYHNTGFQFCRWLVTLSVKLPRPKVFLHSQNATGRANMKDLLSKCGFPVVEFPFSPSYVQMLKQI